MKYNLSTPLLEMSRIPKRFSMRVSNFGIHTVLDLCRTTKLELMSFVNVGERSIMAVENLLSRMGLRFGMDEADLVALMDDGDADLLSPDKRLSECSIDDLLEEIKRRFICPN